MEVKPIFSVAIGKSSEPELLPVARKLLEDNKETLLASEEKNLRTTLRTYNATKNCEVLNNPGAVAKISQVIEAKAKDFYAELGFDVDVLDFEVANLWLNEMSSDSSHSVHSHYGYQISGCFYVDVPDNSGFLRLYTPLNPVERTAAPVRNFTQYSAEFFCTTVQEGDMFFWESMLKHGVPELKFEGLRHSIAYDVRVSKKVEGTKETAYPKRNNFSFLPKAVSSNKSIEDYIAIYNVNDPAFCSKILRQLEDNWAKHHYVHPISRESTTYEDDLDVSFQNELVTSAVQRLFERCARQYVLNFSPDPFDLREITQIRFNRYGVGTNMKRHHDHIHSIFDGERKGVPILTFLMLLNDDFEGGDFIMFGNKKVNLAPGDIIVFPSNFAFPHEVTTVTKGIRYSCVAWGY
jgi:uncharacterized protein (TIGR02466 family)